jgi:hypothetical protein
MLRIIKWNFLLLGSFICYLISRIFSHDEDEGFSPKYLIYFYSKNIKEDVEIVFRLILKYSYIDDFIFQHNYDKEGRKEL